MTNSKSSLIHKTAEVLTSQIGENTSIWQFSVILAGARIGSNCNINCHTFVENDVIIGNNVTVKSGVFLWDGITVENDVFIGPNATFTNDKFPRSKQYPDNPIRTLLKKKCSIGANATILGGVTIGEFAMIAAGSVITKNVPAHALIKGNPGKISGWVDENGQPMKKLREDKFQSNNGQIFKVTVNTLLPE